MTERLYENDSYLQEFEATVVSCVPASGDGLEDGEQNSEYFQVVLDRTVFFPEGGGQNADTGWINGQPVTDVQIKDDIIYHKVKGPLTPGEKIPGKIDWKMRFSNMQQHSGEHIFSGLVHRHYGFNNVGFHLGSQAVTMDFDGPLSAGDVSRIEWEANEAIGKNVPITVSYPAGEALEQLEYRSKIEIPGQVRIVTVEGYDVCACCAPHVSHTGAIGGLKVVDFQKYKGGTRVSMLCGLRALEDFRQKQVQVQSISRQLSAPGDQVAAAVERYMEESGRLRQEIYRLTQQLIMKDIDAIEDGASNVWFFRENLDASVMRKIVNKTLDKASGFCGVFCGNDSDGYKYVLGSKTQDARIPAKQLQEHLGARGGGSAAMVQGFAGASREAITGLLPQGREL